MYNSCSFIITLVLNRETAYIQLLLLPQHFFLYNQSLSLYLFNYFFQKLYFLNYFLFYKYITHNDNFIITPRFFFNINYLIEQFILYQITCKRFVDCFLINTTYKIFTQYITCYVMIAAELYISINLFQKFTKTLLSMCKADFFLFERHSLLTVQFYNFIYLFLSLFKNKNKHKLVKKLPRYTDVYMLPIHDLRNAHLSNNLIIYLYYLIFNMYNLAGHIESEWGSLYYSKFFSYYYYTVYKNTSILLMHKIIHNN